MVGEKRKICDMLDDLDARLSAVESITRRVQALNGHRDYHILDQLLRELATVSGHC